MAKSRSDINKDRYERTKAGLVKLKPYITLAQEDKFLSVLRGESNIVPQLRRVSDMGVDVSGKMLIGNNGDAINAPVDEDEFNDWAEENGLDSCPLYFDAPREDTMYGFEVDEIDVDHCTPEWLENLHELGRKFKEITGADAVLFGTQSVT